MTLTAPAPRLRVWVDAQLPPAVAHWLATDHGVEATHVQDLGLRDARDNEIFDRARHEGVVVLTKDQDFVQLLERHGPPPQVIWVTTGNLRNREFRAILARHWPMAVELLIGRSEPLVEIGGSR